MLENSWLGFFYFCSFKLILLGFFCTFYISFQIYEKYTPVRAYSSSLLCAIIACTFSKYFQILYIFTQIFKYLALSCRILTFFTGPFLPFSWKIACMSLLSRIGPASKTNGNLKDIRWTSLCLVLLYYCKDWRDEEQSA